MSKYPSDWLSKPLGKVYPKIVVGYVGNVNDHYCRAEEGVPFYRTLNIRDGYFRHSEHLYVTHEFNEKNKKSQITNNDILIARVGANLGMVCKADGISGLANMANAIIIKTNDVNSADADFYTSFLLSPMGKNQIYSGAAGGAQGVFNTKLTQEIIVPVPPLPEQRKITKILSTWDKAITTTERLIAASQQQKKALMQQLLTGKKRLLNPKTGNVFEGDWEEVLLGSIANLTAGGTPSTKHPDYWGGNIPWMNSGEINLKKVFGVEGRITDLGLKKSSTKIIPADSVLIALAGQGKTRGTVAINRIELCTNQSIAAVMPDSSLLCSDFLYFNLDSRYQELRSLSTGDGGRGGLNLSILKSIKIDLPPLDEQQKIASVLTAADKEIELLEAKLAHFKEEKKALMQQLLTGKRRVKVETTEAA
ncbi:TPA: restriction endonuclease subunit S [Vibrio cholerae]|nr:restriction endonuclease subunit S [Vibrio cholerae]